MKSTPITLLDGSVGQEIVKRSGTLATPLWSTSVMIEKPEIVAEVHRDYFRSGASVATTNTYNLLYDRLKPFGLEKELLKLWDIALSAALNARAENGSGLVAASLGPLKASYRPDICPSPSESEILYSEIINNISSEVDILLIETMCSVDQAEGALRAATKSSKPVWISFSVDDFDGNFLLTTSF